MSGGNARVVHDLFREQLRALDLRGACAWPEDGYARVSQLVGDTRDERCLRPHHNEIDLERRREGEQPFGVLGADGMAATESGDAGVAGRRMELVEARRLAQLPGERMLACARTDEEDLHTRTVTRREDGFGKRPETQT